MFFLQASKAPVAVTIDDNVYLVPKMRIKDLSEWGSKIRQDNIDTMTKGMEGTQRQEYLAFYDIPMPDINAFRKLVVTLDGSTYILSTQLAKAKTNDGNTLDQGAIADLLENLAHGTRARLAWEIADMEDRSEKNVQDKGKADTSNP